MDLRTLTNVAYAVLTEGMTSDALRAWKSKAEPGRGPRENDVVREHPENRNVAALMASFGQAGRP